ncbi:MAG: hypothetical protein HY286_15520 [Planctomycetes bacterium]|nr:hypothetical protein [Planctomycetota bacterium]
MNRISLSLVSGFALVSLLLVPAHARVGGVNGPLSGTWKIVVHSKKYMDDGSKTANKVQTVDATFTDDSLGSNSNVTITITPTEGDPPFMLTGKRIANAFRVDSDPLASEQITLAGSAAMNKKTGFANSANGTGSSLQSNKIELLTFTAKRTGP